MKNIIKAFLILIIFLTQSALICSAQVIEKKDVIPHIEKTITAQLLENGCKNVQVTVISIPFIKLTLPDGVISYKLSSNSKLTTERGFILASIYVNNEFIRTIGVPIKISAQKDVYIARETIQRGAALTSNMLQVKTVDITNTYVLPLEAGELNKEFVTTKLFQAGSIIDKRYLKSRPDIMKNSEVTMYFKSKDDLSITIDGIAVTDGNIGDIISVQNKKYNRIYNGKIIGENKVLIKI